MKVRLKGEGYFIYEVRFGIYDFDGDFKRKKRRLSEP